MRILNGFVRLLIAVAVLIYFYKSSIKVEELPFQHKLEWMYEVLELVVIAILVTWLEHKLRAVAIHLQLNNNEWITTSSKCAQNCITIIMFIVVAILFGIAITSTNIYVIVIFAILTLLAWVIWLLLAVTIEGAITVVTNPLPTLYIASAAVIIIVYFIMKDHVFVIDKTTCVLNKEIMFRFAEAFMVVGARSMTR